jgi:hypothetical protein
MRFANVGCGRRDGWRSTVQQCKPRSDTNQARGDMHRKVVVRVPLLPQQGLNQACFYSGGWQCLARAETSHLPSTRLESISHVCTGGQEATPTSPPSICRRYLPKSKLARPSGGNKPATTPSFPAPVSELAQDCRRNAPRFPSRRQA